MLILANDWKLANIIWTLRIPSPKILIEFTSMMINAGFEIRALLEVVDMHFPKTPSSQKNNITILDKLVDWEMVSFIKVYESKTNLKKV